MIELKRSEVGAVEETVELFSIDGKAYSIPAKPRVNVALRYLWHAKQHGEDKAAGELLEALLGAAGFEALVSYDALTAEDFAAIVKAAQHVTLGAMETAMGESGRGQSR